MANESRTNRSDISRRKFMKRIGLGAAAIGAVSVLPGIPRIIKAATPARDFILVGHPESLTGPLAGLGEPTAWTNERLLKVLNKDGGIFVKEAGKKLPVQIKVVDTQSDPTKSSDVASKLIVGDKVDLMLVMYTPDVVNPVTAVCERYEMPCISLGVPAEAWLQGGPYQWSFMAFWSIDTWTDLYMKMWDQVAGQTNKVVGGLFPNDPDGTQMAPFFKKMLEAKGYKFIDPGRFPYFNKDFSSIINQFKKENVDILTGSLIAPDFTTVWRQCHQQGFIPKMVTMGKALLFPSALEAVGGEIGHGMTCELWWHKNHPFKSSLTGEMPKDVCEAWEKETSRQWTPSLGFKHAGLELVYDTLNRAGSLDKKVIRDAIEKTDLKTLVGPIKWDAQHVCETPLVGGQWVKGKKWPYEIEVVHSGKRTEIPPTAKMVFPLPK